jgi:hypothetical protein
MSMLASTIVDTHAFVRVALYGVLAAVGLVLAFSGALLAFERAEGDGEDAGGGATVGVGARVLWLGVTALLGAGCIALLAAGVWAMTQK